MKNKYLTISALLFPLMALTLWLGSLEIKVLLAPEVSLAARGYDPRSLISGHYILLQIDWESSDCSQFGKDGCPAGRFENIYRFYLPEDAARIIDKEARDNSLEMQLVFAYPAEQEPLLRRLKIDGMPWQEWLKGQ